MNGKNRIDIRIGMKYEVREREEEIGRTKRQDDDDDNDDDNE